MDVPFIPGGRSATVGRRRKPRGGDLRAPAREGVPCRYPARSVQDVERRAIGGPQLRPRQQPGSRLREDSQAAHGDLVLPHIRGDEELRLDGLVPGGGMLRVTLPGLALVAHHHWLDGRQVHARLTLDGVHLDLRRDEGPWRVDLTWRGLVEACPAYDGAVLLPVRLADADGLPVLGEHGLREPEVIA